MRFTLLIIALLFTGLVFAQEDPGTGGTEKADKTEKTESAKPDKSKKPNPGTIKKAAESGQVELPKTDNEKALVLYVEGVDMKESKQYNQAMENFTKAVELDPKFAQAFLERAGLKFLSLDFAGALADYDKCIEILQKKRDDHQMQGDIKVILDDMPSARLDFEKVSQIDPILADAYYRRGNVKRFMDRDGCEDLNKAKELGHLKANPDLKDYCQ